MRGDDGGEFLMGHGFGTWEVEDEGLGGEGWEEVVQGLGYVGKLGEGGRAQDQFKARRRVVRAKIVDDITKRN